MIEHYEDDEHHDSTACTWCASTKGVGGTGGGDGNHPVSESVPVAPGAASLVAGRSREATTKLRAREDALAEAMTRHLDPPYSGMEYREARIWWLAAKFVLAYYDPMETALREIAGCEVEMPPEALGSVAVRHVEMLRTELADSREKALAFRDIGFSHQEAREAAEKRATEANLDARYMRDAIQKRYKRIERLAAGLRDAKRTLEGPRDWSADATREGTAIQFINIALAPGEDS